MINYDNYTEKAVWLSYPIEDRMLTMQATLWDLTWVKLNFTIIVNVRHNKICDCSRPIDILVVIIVIKSNWVKQRLKWIATHGLSKS